MLRALDLGKRKSVPAGFSKETMTQFVTRLLNCLDLDPHLYINVASAGCGCSKKHGHSSFQVANGWAK